MATPQNAGRCFIKGCCKATPLTVLVLLGVALLALTPHLLSSNSFSSIGLTWASLQAGYGTANVTDLEAWNMRADAETPGKEPRYVNYIKDVNTSKFPDNYIFYGLRLREVQDAAVLGTVGDYLPEYKTPCWRARLKADNQQTDGKSHKSSNLTSKMASKLVCLPYFYIIGVAKCGTTDLRGTLSRHPDLYPSKMAEPMYWNRKRIQRHMTLSAYTDMFKDATAAIERSTRPLPDGSGSFHHKLAYEKSPSYLWDFQEWTKLPGAKNFSEPPYTAADTIYRITPMARIIMLLRNPVDRLYSHYNHFRGKLSTPDDFHSITLRYLKGMKKCLQKYSPKTCVQSPSKISEIRPVFLRASMYVHLVTDWLKVFPRNQIFILRSEDYYAIRAKPVADILNFLGIDTPMPPYVAGLTANKRHYKPMRQDTRQALTYFYRPYNEELAALLGDDRYLWL